MDDRSKSAMQYLQAVAYFDLRGELNAIESQSFFSGAP
ncbi:hypothetical protein ARTHRO8AJ_90044 [Arthrobacter sp. 8AJ]|nr:hypothetical protein ARTHRO8AJ_90044 [Arthrobacter sp. 8AJ]